VARGVAPLLRLRDHSLAPTRALARGDKPASAHSGMPGPFEYALSRQRSPAHRPPPSIESPSTDPLASGFVQGVLWAPRPTNGEVDANAALGRAPHRTLFLIRPPARPLVLPNPRGLYRTAFIGPMTRPLMFPTRHRAHPVVELRLPPAAPARHADRGERGFRLLQRGRPDAGRQRGAVAGHTAGYRWKFQCRNVGKPTR
jgi:hypothetical protein